MGHKPGPLCRPLLGLRWIDTGTLARTRHTPPVPTGKHPHVTQAKKQELTSLRRVPSNVNIGLSAPTETFMISLLGRPRKQFSQDCQPVTNKWFQALIDELQIGRSRVYGLRPAIQSLKQVLNQIRACQPEIYQSIGTVGMLCCRYQRRAKRISNHSWGTAIDLTICGKLDGYGDGRVQNALALIAPVFNRNGWVWGATYPKEDGMHFEVSKEKLQRWKDQGILPKKIEESSSAGQVSRGDSGNSVREVQLMLNRNGANLAVDGNFGAATELEVKKYQMRKALVTTGVVDQVTLLMLREENGRIHETYR